LSKAGLQVNGQSMEGAPMAASTTAKADATAGKAEKSAKPAKASAKPADGKAKPEAAAKSAT
jgi:competence protein ComEA